MLDILLGTIDRKDLDHENMKPERRMWCAMGVPWIMDMADRGAGGIPAHPLTKIDKVLGDNIESDLEELKAMEESAMKS
jgi:hypothetical protein